MSHIKYLSAFFLTLFLILFAPFPVLAATTAVKITDPIPNSFIWPGGQTFYFNHVNLNYQTGRIILSSNPDGSGDIWVDDAADFQVTNNGGPEINNIVDFSEGCANLHQIPPKDITSFFPPGNNQITVILRDQCGGYAGSSALYLVNVTGTDPVPSPSPTPGKTPLIFIPGFGGSELKVKNDTHLSIDNGHGGTFVNDYKSGDKVWVNNLQTILPGEDDYFDALKMKFDGITSEVDLEPANLYAGSYGSTINFFTENGYILNKDFFVFPYDWRNDVLKDTPKLEQKIAEIKKATGTKKVDIVAHSMGGLVARSYLDVAGNSVNVRKFISLGTPYLGTPKFLNALLYGDCIKFDIKLGCLSLAPSELKDVIQNMSGGYQLAPSSAYFRFYDGSDLQHPVPFADFADIDNNQVTGPLNYTQTKDLLNNLKDLVSNSGLYNFNENLHSLDSNPLSLNGVDTTIIVGSGISTLGQIAEKNVYDSAGHKIIKKDPQMINGDGTVTLYSSSLIDQQKSLNLAGGSKIYYFKLKHEDLVANKSSLTLVKNILNNSNELPFDVSSNPYLVSGFLFSVHSPVNLDIFDENSNHTGLNQNGGIEENIPGSVYTAVDDAKLIWVPNNGKYNIKFSAIDSGSFDFKIKKYQNDQVSQTILYQNVPLTKSTKAEAILDSAINQPPVLELDQNGDGTIDSKTNSNYQVSGDLPNDLTPPEIKLMFNMETKNLGFQGIDNIAVTSTSSNDSTINIGDEAGNLAKFNIDFKDKKKKDKIQVNNVSYNGNSSLQFDENLFSTTFKDNYLIEQKVVIKGVEKLKATYNPKSNKTTLIRKENGQKKTEEQKDGLIFIFLKTNNGDLEVGF